MDTKLKVVLILVGVALLLVGVQVGLVGWQLSRPDMGPEEAARGSAMRSLAGLLSPLAPALDSGRIGQGCGREGLTFSRSPGRSECTINIRPDPDTRFASLEVHVREGGTLHIDYRPRNADSSETNTVDPDSSATVPVMKEGGTLGLDCRGEEDCRVEFR